MASRRAPARPRLLTLTSDLGAAYAAQMKAVLLRTVAPGQVVDLAHDLTPHAVGEAAFLLRAMAREFPPGSIHVVVVDPGVGGTRAPVVLSCRRRIALVGPDNGVLYPLAKELGLFRAHRIDPRRLRRARIGTTFDGRDVFAPAAALLAQGRPPSDLGPPVRPTPLALPEPRRDPPRLEGEVVLVDRFGNLITNLPTAWLSPSPGPFRVRVGRRAWVVPRVSSYEALGPGRLGLLGSSFGTLELARSGGRASDRLSARAGDRVTLEPRPRRPGARHGK